MCPRFLPTLQNTENTWRQTAFSRKVKRVFISCRLRRRFGRGHGFVHAVRRRADSSQAVHRFQSEAVTRSSFQFLSSDLSQSIRNQLDLTTREVLEFAQNLSALLQLIHSFALSRYWTHWQ